MAKVKLLFEHNGPRDTYLGPYTNLEGVRFDLYYTALNSDWGGGVPLARYGSAPSKCYFGLSQMATQSAVFEASKRAMFLGLRRHENADNW